MFRLEGNEIAEKIKSNIKQEIQGSNLNPTLGIILVGNDPASEVYVEKKKLAARQVGIKTKVFRFLQANTDELLKLTNKLNKDVEISGYIIQLPLPKNIDSTRILNNIAIEKDVDGLNIKSRKLLKESKPYHISATALAVMQVITNAAIWQDEVYTEEEIFLKEKQILEKFLPNKKVLIINDSILVGKPLRVMLNQYGSIITIANIHTKPEELKESIRNNEIIVSATGVPGLIKSANIVDGQVLVDVGINKSAVGIGGDIDYDGMEQKNVFITPVPGGVGPITVAKLLENTLRAAMN